MNSNIEKIGCDVICKSHSARTERDLYRICPSKLSKRELEDLYFALLENNLELKKTINVQQDKIKVLSTRLQRMTVVHKNVAGKEKDCCASKAVVSEQKESLTDLKKTNERMAERIRLLNMKLCSAKQFLKRSPLQSTNSNKICTRCTFKNSSMSALNAKRSDSNMRTTTVSCQFLENDVAEKSTRTVETETEVPEKEDSEKLCNENKCRTMMDELKEKIVNLQEELAISHNEYSERIAKLESQVCQLNDENLRVRSNHVASEHALQERVRKADLLQDKLRTADAKCNELNMELSIEKRKVAELETGLKLANISKHVVETINQLAAEKEDKQDPLSELCRNRSCCSDTSQKQRVYSPKAQLEIPSIYRTKNEVKISTSEDSGYTELNKSCETEDDQAMVKTNRELLKKIADLQTQLDVLRISTAGEVGCKQSKKPKDFESYDVETKDIDETQTENAADPGFMLKSTSDDQTEAERDKNTTPGNGEMACSSKHENDEDKIDNENMHQAIETSAIQHKSQARVLEDEHNSFQIPGPIPVEYPSQSFSKEKRNYRNTQFSKDYDSERPKNKKANSEEKTAKIIESNDSNFNNVKRNESIGEEAVQRSKDMAEKRHKIANITDVQANLADRTPTRDSIFANRKKLASQNGASMAEVKKESITSFYFNGICSPSETAEKAGQVTHVQENADTSVYGTQIEHPPMPKKRDSATYTAEAANTYTVEAEKRSRATSPDNTEHEISSMTDLPSEKDAKSPRAYLSPGEEKATMTYTDTETMPTDYGSLSEGEMPLAGRKVRTLSIGETPTVAKRTYSPVVTSTEKMEATLRSISGELARCRELLLSQRPREGTAYSSIK